MNAESNNDTDPMASRHNGPKKVLVALPKGLLQQIDAVALAEHRSRSDLIREALRRYLTAFKKDHATLSILDNGAAKIYADSI